MQPLALSLWVIAWVLATVAGATNDDRRHQHQPIQVYILAGQSNTKGHGSIDHLDSLIANATTRADFEILWDTDTRRYKTRNDVYIKHNDAHGKLTVSRNAGYAVTNKFGPEVMVGWTIGDALTQTAPKVTSNVSSARVLLIKTAWGGKSLSVDFRPPSAGLGNYTGVNTTLYGQYYRVMILDIQDTLNNMRKYIPNYETDQQMFELSGFLWFHGWNDVLEWNTVNEYGLNLARFIRDVRRDLATPNLPFVIGELGMFGVNSTEYGSTRAAALQAAQRNVTLMDEFRSSTLFVRTSQYAVSNGQRFDGIHHYYGRADTYFYMSQAMGRGMLQLLDSMNVTHLGRSPVGTIHSPTRAPFDSSLTTYVPVIPTDAPVSPPSPQGHVPTLGPMSVLASPQIAPQTPSPPPTLPPTQNCGVWRGGRLCLFTSCGFFGRMWGRCRQSNR